MSDLDRYRPPLPVKVDIADNVWTIYDTQVGIQCLVNHWQINNVLQTTQPILCCWATGSR